VTSLPQQLVHFQVLLFVNVNVAGVKIWRSQRIYDVLLGGSGAIGGRYAKFLMLFERCKTHGVTVTPPMQHSRHNWYP
jgi:hypothetical protein